MNLQELEHELSSLTVFGELDHNEVFSAFRTMLFMLEHKDALSKASSFAWQLYQKYTDNWTGYLCDLVLYLETPCSYFAGIGKPIPTYIEQAARHDLSILSEAAGVTPELVAYCMGQEESYIPGWKAYSVDLESLYFDRLSEIGKHGFGLYAKSKMFHMELSNANRNGFVLEPVRYPDTVQLSDLIGYERQRTQVIENTRALLAGQKAANVLLYGDAGTGKSATVKAVANAYADEGLRLIELTKEELHLLPKLLDELAANPLKFILFIDDLSFQDNDDNFSALKAVLEGSISARSHNTVIYATSNRRHIVRETFSQRAGDEIHRNDTMQETISLSERFGIRILYDKPNKQLYLDIVKGLADQYGLSMTEDELELEAERFATRRSGRSARAARQFVEQLCAAKSTKNKE